MPAAEQVPGDDGAQPVHGDIEDAAVHRCFDEPSQPLGQDEHRHQQQPHQHAGDVVSSGVQPVERHDAEEPGQQTDEKVVVNREKLVANALQTALRRRRTGVRGHQHHPGLLVDVAPGGERSDVGSLAVEQLGGVGAGRVLRRQLAHARKRRDTAHLCGKLPAVPDLAATHPVEHCGHLRRAVVDGGEAVVQDAGVNDLAAPQGASLPPPVVGGGVAEGDEHRGAESEHRQHRGGVLPLDRIRHRHQQSGDDQDREQIAAKLPQHQTEDPDRAQASGGPDHPIFPRRRLPDAA